MAKLTSDKTPQTQSGPIEPGTFSEVSAPNLLPYEQEQLLALQRAAGNRAVHRLLQRPEGSSIQFKPQPGKLSINTPGDRYEQEADQVANRILQPGSKMRLSLSAGYFGIQRKCAACAASNKPCSHCEEEEEIQRKEIGTISFPSAVSPLETSPQEKTGLRARIQVMRAGGQKLPNAIRKFFESRFQFDFHQVHIHTDAQAARTARHLNARAFTAERDVVFGAGEYSPETSKGRHLLAHELAHVVQQTSGGRAAAPAIQRQITTDGRADSRFGEEAQEAAVSGWIVENDVFTLSPGQMKKVEFLTEIRTAVCRTVKEAIASTGQTTENCPYLEFVFRYFSSRNAAYLNTLLGRFAVNNREIRSARSYIPIITERVRRSAEVWARTGQISGLPEGIPTSLREGVISADRGRGRSHPAGNISLKSESSGSNLSGAPQAVQMQLGEGRPLDGRVKTRMETAFGENFSHVRIHTDGSAAQISKGYNARALTVGEHIAFGSGEYSPGTLIGDALIAHELAHVIQQGDAIPGSGPTQLDDSRYDNMEEDADLSAVRAITSIVTGFKGILTALPKNAVPRLRSGLRLQRCGGDCPPGYCWQVVDATAAAAHCNCIWRCMPVTLSPSQTTIDDPYRRPRTPPTGPRWGFGALGGIQEGGQLGPSCGCTRISEDQGAVCDPPLSIIPSLGGGGPMPGIRGGSRSPSIRGGGRGGSRGGGSRGGGGSGSRGGTSTGGTRSGTRTSSGTRGGTSTGGTGTGTRAPGTTSSGRNPQRPPAQTRGPITTTDDRDLRSGGYVREGLHSDRRSVIYRHPDTGQTVQVQLRRGGPAWLSPSWGRNRIERELRSRGYRLERATRGEGGQIFRNSETGEEIRIMPRPADVNRDEPIEKHLNSWYFRYRTGPDQQWGDHTTIPDTE